MLAQQDQNQQPLDLIDMIAKQCVPPFYSKFQLPSKHIEYTIKGGMITKKTIAFKSSDNKLKLQKSETKLFFLEKQSIFFTHCNLQSF